MNDYRSPDRPYDARLSELEEKVRKLDLRDTFWEQVAKVTGTLIAILFGTLIVAGVRSCAAEYAERAARERAEHVRRCAMICETEGMRPGWYDRARARPDCVDLRLHLHVSRGRRHCTLQHDDGGCRGSRRAPIGPLSVRIWAPPRVRGS